MGPAKLERLRAFVRVKPTKGCHQFVGVSEHCVRVLDLDEAVARQGRNEHDFHTAPEIIQLKRTQQKLEQVRPLIEMTKFQRVFNPQEPTGAVFDALCTETAKRVVQGFNETILMYGQTGSGKTYTMFGPPTEGPTICPKEQQGVLPLLFRQLLEEAKACDQLEGEEGFVSIETSCFEIYNEKMRDLYNPNNDINAFTMLQERRGKMIRPNNSGLPHRIQILSADGVDGPMVTVKAAARERCTAENIGRGQNQHRSSRSHMVVQIHVLTKTGTCGTATLVDLAGSEKVEDSRGEKARREGTNIRKSLNALTNMLLHMSRASRQSGKSARKSSTGSIDSGRKSSDSSNASSAASSTRRLSARGLDAGPSSVASSTSSMVRRLSSAAMSDVGLAPRRRASSISSGSGRAASGRSDSGGAVSTPRSFRDSKLTMALEGLVGGSARTSVIFCINPETNQVSQSLQTLELAVHSMRIESMPVTNILRGKEPSPPKDSLLRLSDNLSQREKMLADEARNMEALLAETRRRLAAALLQKEEIKQGYEGNLDMREAEIRERVSLEHQTTIDAMRAQLKEVERDREENMRKSAFIQRLQERNSGMLKIMDEKDTKIAALSDQVSLLSSEKAQMAAEMEEMRNKLLAAELSSKSSSSSTPKKSEFVDASTSSKRTATDAATTKLNPLTAGPQAVKFTRAALQSTARAHLSRLSPRIGMACAPHAERGLLVKALEPAQAAVAAGLHQGDIILEVEGRAVNNDADLSTALAQVKPGAWVHFRIQRPGLNAPMSLPVMMGSRELPVKAVLSLQAVAANEGTKRDRAAAAAVLAAWMQEPESPSGPDLPSPSTVPVSPANNVNLEPEPQPLTARACFSKGRDLMGQFLHIAAAEEQWLQDAVVFLQMARKKDQRYHEKVVATAQMVGPRGVTAMMKAVAVPELMRLLSALGTPVNAADRQGRTALMHAAINGDSIATQILLSLGADAGAVDKQGCTALMHGARVGNCEALSALHEHVPNLQVDARDKSGMTALMIAVRVGGKACLAAAAALRQYGASVDAQDNEGMTAAMLCAARGDHTSLRLLVGLSANPEVCDSQGRNALMLASFWGQLKCVGTLLQGRAKTSAADNSGMTPLMLAALRGEVKVAQMLVRHGAELEARDSEGMTALIVASHNGKVDALKELWTQGGNLEARDNRGRTALIRAAYWGEIEAVKTLVGLGADVNAKDDRGRNALAVARSSTECNQEVVELLQRLCHDSSEQELQEISVSRSCSPIAPRRGSIGADQLWSLPDHLPVDILSVSALRKDSCSSCGSPVLTHRSGRSSACNSIASSVHGTPFTRARSLNSGGRGGLALTAAVVEAMEAQDEDEDEQEEQLVSAPQTELAAPKPVLVAVSTSAGSETEALRLLATAEESLCAMLARAAQIGDELSRVNPDLSRVSPEEWEALLQELEQVVAEWADCRPQVQRVLGTTDPQGNTLLMHVAALGLSQAVRRAVWLGADVNCREHQGRTALLVAAAQGAHALSILRELVELGAEIDSVDAQGQTAMMLATISGELGAVKLLTQAGAAVELKDGRGRTALSHAAVGGKCEVLRLLAVHGAELDTRDEQEHTPLMQAAYMGETDAVALLAGMGANMDAIDREGRTAVHIAAINGEVPVVRLLQSLGAQMEVRDAFGQTAIENAARWGRDESVDALARLGARGVREF